MVGDIGIGAADGRSRGQVLRLQHLTIRGENEFGFGRLGLGAGFQVIELCRGLTLARNGHVDVVALEQAAHNVQQVGIARSESLEGNILVSKGREELEGKFSRVKGQLCQLRNSLFDLNGVLRCPLQKVILTLPQLCLHATIWDATFCLVSF